MNRVLPMAVMLTLLAGCQATYREPTLPADHPANPGGDAAAPAEHSHTLATTTSDMASSEAAKPAMTGEHGGDIPASVAPGAALYVCPMHPEVTSDNPDQRCPKCGMKLVKKDGGKQP